MSFHHISGSVGVGEGVGGLSVGSVVEVGISVSAIIVGCDVEGGSGSQADNNKPEVKTNTRRRNIFFMGFPW
jgi:hypothetical protein